MSWDRKNGWMWRQQQPQQHWFHISLQEQHLTCTPLVPGTHTYLYQVSYMTLHHNLNSASYVHYTTVHYIHLIFVFFYQAPDTPKIYERMLIVNDTYLYIRRSKCFTIYQMIFFLTSTFVYYYSVGSLFRVLGCGARREHAWNQGASLGPGRAQ